MPRWIVRLAEDAYVEWSTVVDAPVSMLHTRDEAVCGWGRDRVERADAHVTSCVEPAFWYDSPEEFVAGNRAGPGESELSLDDLLHALRRERQRHGPPIDLARRAAEESAVVRRGLHNATTDQLRAELARRGET